MSIFTISMDTSERLMKNTCQLTEGDLIFNKSLKIIDQLIN